MFMVGLVVICGVCVCDCVLVGCWFELLSVILWFVWLVNIIMLFGFVLLVSEVVWVVGLVDVCGVVFDVVIDLCYVMVNNFIGI